MASDVNPSLEELYDGAFKMRYTKQPEAAIELFGKFIQGSRDNMGDPRVREAYAQALSCVGGRKLWDDTVTMAQEAIAYFPDHAVAHQYLGEALWGLGRDAEAASALERAIELDSENGEARSLLSIVRRGRSTTRNRRKLRPWPSKQADFADPKALIQRALLKGNDADRFISKDTAFMTFGSCFAGNLGKRLRTLGFTVNYEVIGEEVNSTYANRYMMQWIENGVTDGQTQVMEDSYGPAMRDRIRAGIIDSDVFVLTLGVAPCFFDEKGEFTFISSRTRTGLGVLQSQYTMRTTTVAENVANISEIIDCIRRMSKKDPTIILTVSPVPLAATTEFDSAIIADCLSKSTMRLACHEAIVARPGEKMIYWPSFEIVRWIGVHFDQTKGTVFGEEDGSTRHVSHWVIAMIMDLFLSEYRIQDPAAAVSSGASDSVLAMESGGASPHTA